MLFTEWSASFLYCSLPVTHTFLRSLTSKKLHTYLSVALLLELGDFQQKIVPADLLNSFLNNKKQLGLDITYWSFLNNYDIYMNLLVTTTYI